MELTPKQEIAKQVHTYIKEHPGERVGDVCDKYGIKQDTYYRTARKLGLSVSGKGGRKPRAPQQLPLERAIAKAERQHVDLRKPQTLHLDEPTPQPSLLAGKSIVIMVDTKDLVSALAGLVGRGM